MKNGLKLQNLHQNKFDQFIRRWIFTWVKRVAIHQTNWRISMQYRMQSFVRVLLLSLVQIYLQKMCFFGLFWDVFSALLNDFRHDSLFIIWRALTVLLLSWCERFIWQKWREVSKGWWKAMKFVLFLIFLLFCRHTMFITVCYVSSLIRNHVG